MDGIITWWDGGGVWGRIVSLEWDINKEEDVSLYRMVLSGYNSSLGMVSWGHGSMGRMEGVDEAGSLYRIVVLEGQKLVWFGIMGQQALIGGQSVDMTKFCGVGNMEVFISMWTALAHLTYPCATITFTPQFLPMFLSPLSW